MFFLANGTLVVVSIRCVFLFIEQWSSPEDRLALAGLGFAGLVYIWAARNLISVKKK